METYKNRHDSKIYGSRLIVYRWNDAQDGGSYYFRAKIDGYKGYIRRTTKETNPDRALLLAEQEYENLRVRDKGGLSLKILSYAIPLFCSIGADVRQFSLFIAS